MSLSFNVFLPLAETVFCIHEGHSEEYHLILSGTLKISMKENVRRSVENGRC